MLSLVSGGSGATIEYNAKAVLTEAELDVYTTEGLHGGILGSGELVMLERRLRVFTDNERNVLKGMARVFVFTGDDAKRAWSYSSPTLLHGDRDGWAYSVVYIARLHTGNL